MGPLSPFSELAAQFPGFAQALARHAAGDLEAARALYLPLLEQPRLTSACLHQLASLAVARGELPLAADLLQYALRLDPAQLPSHSLLANTLWHLGRGAAGLAVLLEQGCTLQLAERFADAEIPYREILQHDPLNYGAHVNLGTCLAQMQRLPEATQHMLLALRLYGRLNRNVLDFALGLQQRLRVQLGLPLDAELPEGPPSGRIEKIEDAVTTLGKLMSEQALPEEALRCHRLSVALAPGFALGHWNLSLALLALRDYALGWQKYEWRWHWPGFPAARRQRDLPQWSGQPLAGKRLLVWAEQGFGDTMQFAPLLLRLANRGAQISWEVAAPLQRLMAHSLPEVQVLPASEPHAQPPGGPYDYGVAQLSLPALLHMETQPLPWATHYLQADAVARARWAELLGARTVPRVGIAWNGRAKPNARRSVPFDTLAPLLARRQVRWISLQVGDAQHDIPAAGPHAMLNPADGLQDFADTAALMTQLDLVITIDSAVAHLAGALGVRTWLMLLPVPDWRWQDSQPDADGHECSRWYPQVRLFRQERDAGWAPVVQALGLALDAALQTQAL